MVGSRLVWPALVAAVMLGGSWASGCPQSCTCRHQHNLLTANCSSLPYNGGKVESLTLLPRDTPVELSDGQFNLAKHLKYLTLKNSSIYFVHKKAFYGAKRILEIDLSFNYIEDLDSTVFQHLTNLTRLSLRGNPIHFMSGMPFLISNSLTHLDIGQCNIKYIPIDIFYELKRLTYLSLDGNYLTSIVYNSLPKGIKYLDISNNLIVNVPTEVISSLINVGRLGLAGNPINCTCSLMNFQDWFSGKGVIFEDDVICNLPNKYKGVSWSKVDENKLCLVEARREELQYSSSSLMKRRLPKEPYNYKDFYIEENIQSDQPGLVPDSEVEIFNENDETLAMGEMMRDEEDKSGIVDETSDKTDTSTSETNIKNHSDKIDDAVKTGLFVESDEDHVSTTTSGGGITDNTEDINVNTIVESVHNGKSEIADLNSHKNIYEKDANKENIADIVISETQDKNNSNYRSISDITQVAQPNETGKEDIEENFVNQTQLTSGTNLETDKIEYKTLNEEETEVDEFKREGLFHVDGKKYRVDENITVEESTVIPDEDTTEDEFSGQGPLIGEGNNEIEDALVYSNIKSTSEINNTTTNSEEAVKSDEDIGETVPPPVIVSNIYGSNEGQQNTSENNINIIESKNTTEILIGPLEDPDNENKHQELTESVVNRFTTPENRELPLQTELPTAPSENPKSEVESSEKTFNDTSQQLNILNEQTKEDKIKEMAGAEVVMFCVAVLVICLVLYSVYKCRSSKNRASMQISKDLESNRDTEMQDMASLLPKSQEERKDNLKYDDKAPSSETVKLLSEQNENEIANCTPNPDVKNELEEKNSLNNNTPNSPVKTPLIKPEKNVTISPASPIQRTKVKVGIIPESIPRTPIFLQKTYNGTKNV